jgi:hypothetical protein
MIGGKPTVDATVTVPAAALTALERTVFALYVRLSGLVMGTGVFMGPAASLSARPTIAISPKDRVAGLKSFETAVTVI